MALFALEVPPIAVIVARVRDWISDYIKQQKVLTPETGRIKLMTP